MAQLVKNLPAIQGTWSRSLGCEDPLEKGKATHSSILAWRIPWTIQFMGSNSSGDRRVGHDWATLASLHFTSTYLRLLMFLPPILIPACNSSSPAFLMMCSAYRLIKQGDSRQLCHTPFSVLNQSVVPYRVLTVACWPAYRFLRGQVRRSGILISLRAFHGLLWSTQSKALA